MGKRLWALDVDEGFVEVLALMVAGLAKARTPIKVVPESMVLTARSCVKWTLVMRWNGMKSCSPVSECMR